MNMLSKEKMMEEAIKNAFKEDLGDGDHSSLACVPENDISKAILLIKEEGILAGLDVAKMVFGQFGQFEIEVQIEDGTRVFPNDVAFIVKGRTQGILACERIVLNIIQRMSGIATYTNFLKDLISDTKAQLLDTRKTTPNFRVFEKEAVRIGGGMNHRFGLYDMIMLKDNHVDYAGGVKNALTKTNDYLRANNKELKIEIEVRNFKELEEALDHGGFHRVMFDNFTPEETIKAVEIVNGKFETESSGGITEQTIKSYAEAGVDYISVGALTHHVKSLDIPLTEVARNASKDLAFVHQYLNNTDSALYYWNLSDSLLIEIYSSNYEDRVLEYRAQYETASAELEAEQQRFRALQQERNKRIVLIISIAVVIIFSIWLYIIDQKRKNIKAIAAKNEELNKQRIDELLQQQEIASLQGILEGQEQERKRVAIDLHDRLGGILSMVKLHFSAVEEKLPMIDKVDMHSQFLEERVIDLETLTDKLRGNGHD